MKIVVIGGGIAGLVTALSVHEAGMTPVVCEAAMEIQAVGVGINLLPHAVRELTELGLGEELASIALPPQRLVYCNRRGTQVWEEPLGRAAGYRWPQYSVHRGRLQMMLLDAVRARVGPNAVRTGLAFDRFEHEVSGATAFFLDRRGGPPVAERGDVLVGADGIDSRLRAQLHPGEGPPLGNGVLMWRGMSRHPHVLDGRSLVVAGGRPGDKFVAYPVADPNAPGGQAEMNWVLEISRQHPRSSGEDADNSPRTVPLAEALEHLDGWDLPWVDLAGLVGRSTCIHEHPMTDRNPLPRWSFERVTLIGDAAHPMYPMGMNGGSQSIIDARVLAWCLSHHDDPTQSLAHYESLRRDTLNQLVLANRDLGPEKIIALAEETGVPVPLAQAQEISHSYKQLAGCTADGLNARRSWSVESAVSS